MRTALEGQPAHVFLRVTELATIETQAGSSDAWMFGRVETLISWRCPAHGRAWQASDPGRIDKAGGCTSRSTTLSGRIAGAALP